MRKIVFILIFLCSLELFSAQIRTQMIILFVPEKSNDIIITSFRYGGVDVMSIAPESLILDSEELPHFSQGLLLLGAMAMTYQQYEQELQVNLVSVSKINFTRKYDLVILNDKKYTSKEKALKKLKELVLKWQKLHPERRREIDIKRKKVIHSEKIFSPEKVLRLSIISPEEVVVLPGKFSKIDILRFSSGDFFFKKDVSKIFNQEKNYIQIPGKIKIKELSKMIKKVSNVSPEKVFILIYSNDRARKTADTLSTQLIKNGFHCVLETYITDK